MEISENFLFVFLVSWIIFILFKRNLAHFFQQPVKRGHCWYQCTVEILKEAKQFRQSIEKKNVVITMGRFFFLCLSYVMHFFCHGENPGFSTCLTPVPAPSLTSQVEQLTGWSKLGQLAITPRPHQSMEKFILDLSQQSLPCLSVLSQPVNIVSFLWKFLHLKTQLYPRWRFHCFNTLHLKNIYRYFCSPFYSHLASRVYP